VRETLALIKKWKKLISLVSKKSIMMLTHLFLASFLIAIEATSLERAPHIFFILADDWGKERVHIPVEDVL